MRYWWVNQNQTYKDEVKGRFMWSPKRKKGDQRNPFYDSMREVSPGDVVFSFCDTLVRSIGVVIGHAQTGPKPAFSVASNWANEGWFVPVDYCALDRDFRPKDHIEIIRPFLPAKYSPLQANGNGNQGVYLTEVSKPLADTLIALMGQTYFDAYASVTQVQSAEQLTDEEVIRDREMTGPTFREQLVRSRRGQGVFRSNVLLRENRCRVTLVDEPRHLTASHIKPWRQSTDEERLDGANGLLLSPHIDHLFDEGYITFSNAQELVVVPEVRNRLLDAWGIDAGVRVGEFSREQQGYLGYHRVNVFRKELME